MDARRGLWIGLACALGGWAATPAAASAASMHLAETGYPVGSPAVEIAAGDFDGDGHRDLAVAGAGGVSVLRGRGDGTFAPAVVHPVAAPPRSIAVADFDGDERSDIAAAADATSTVMVLLGNADGTFARAERGVGAAPGMVRAGDVDGDGNADVIVAASGKVIVLRGHGDGTFDGPRPSATNTTGIAQVWVGDFDGDGRADALVPTGTTTGFATMLGKPDGSLTAPALGTPAGACCADVAVADLDGDGRSDALFDNLSAGGVAVRFGAADGTLEPAMLVTGPGAPAVGDVNHDGAPDVVVAGTDGAIAVRSGGAFGLPIAVTAPRRTFDAVWSGDLDGDGFADLALGDAATGEVVVGLNAPAAVVEPAAISLGVLHELETVAVVDGGLPPLAVTGIALVGADARGFRIVGDFCTTRVIASDGDGCNVQVMLDPAAPVGTHSAELTVTTNDPDGPARVAITGVQVQQAPAQAPAVPAAQTAVTPLPQPGDRVAPAVAIAVPAQRLATVLNRGLRAGVSCDEACAIDARAVLSGPVARRVGLSRGGAATIARATRALPAAGRGTVVLRLTRRAVRALRTARRLTLTLTVTARDAAGNARVASRAVRLRR